MHKIVKLNKRQEEIFNHMKAEAKRIYDFQGNWDFNISSYWDERERSFDFPKIKIISESKLRLLDTNLKLNIINQEKYNFMQGLYKQVIKFCQTRIKILSEI